MDFRGCSCRKVLRNLIDNDESSQQEKAVRYHSAALSLNEVGVSTVLRHDQDNRPLLTLTEKYITGINLVDTLSAVGYVKFVKPACVHHEVWYNHQYSIALCVNKR